MKISKVEFDLDAGSVTVRYSGTPAEAKAYVAGVLGLAEETSEAPPAKKAPPPKAKPEPEAPKKPEPKKAKPAPEPEEEDDEDEEEEEDEDEDAEEEEEDEDAEEEEEEKPAKGKGAGEQLKITPELKNAQKLREVLTYLMEKEGVKSAAKLTKICLALKSKVPVLSRIEDLESRVARSAKLIDPNIGA